MSCYHSTTFYIEGKLRRETYAALLYLLTGYFLISCHLRSVEKIEMHFDVGTSADDEQTE